jgi:hypothetical protein
MQIARFVQAGRLARLPPSIENLEFAVTISLPDHAEAQVQITGATSRSGVSPPLIG